MKLVTGCLMLAVLLGATSADAWPWSRRARKLPRPIDSPIIRPKLKEHHKAGKQLHHRSRVEHHGWGREEKVLRSAPVHAKNHSLFEE